MRWYRPLLIESLPEIVRDVDPIIVPQSIPLAFGISVVIGVLFGPLSRLSGGRRWIPSKRCGMNSRVPFSK